MTISCHYKKKWYLRRQMGLIVVVAKNVTTNGLNCCSVLLNEPTCEEVEIASGQDLKHKWVFMSKCSVCKNGHVNCGISDVLA